MIAPTVCSVYVISSGARTKIGVAHEPRLRLAGLERSAGASMQLHGSRQFASRTTAVMVERTLHRQFASVRGLGEWFNLEPRKALQALTQIPEPAEVKRAETTGPLSDDEPTDHTELALRFLEAVRRGSPIPPEVNEFRRKMGVPPFKPRTAGSRKVRPSIVSGGG